MEKILKTFAIIGVILIALTAILLVLDIIQNAEFKDVLYKALMVLVVLTAASAIISFIAKPKQKDIDKNEGVQ
jgi:hypothetical protein